MWLVNGLIGILTYLFLMIDRLVLVPFQWVSSYGVYDLQKKPDRYSTYSMIRVTIALTAVGVYFLIKAII